MRKVEHGSCVYTRRQKALENEKDRSCQSIDRASGTGTGG